MDVFQLAWRIIDVILNPVVALLFSVAFIVFLWGIFQMVRAAGGSGEGLDDGKRHLLWGVVGMFIMVSAYAIVRVAGQTVGATLR
jgi:ABC-type thiamin/hydroxymethylpyrimidine transport system permease subunit